MGNTSNTPQYPSEAFNLLSTVMKQRSFLDKEGLGNEVPFFIYDYAPKFANEMEKLPEQLEKELAKESIRLISIGLYDLSIELIENRGIWEQLIESEADLSKGELLELLQGVLDVDSHIVPAIEERLDNQAFDILCLHQIGAVFPYIRSHTILNNLQRVMKSKPTLILFPGEYSHSNLEGSKLSIFGVVTDDNYYRAFNIKNFG